MFTYEPTYTTDAERLDALSGFLAYYNRQCPHGGIGGATTASRL